MAFPKVLARHNSAVSLRIEPDLRVDLLDSFVVAEEHLERTHRPSKHSVAPSTRYVPP